MPNWKKVIVSGSDAILNSITSSAGVSSSGNIYAPNFIGVASNVGIGDDGIYRVITSNGDGFLKANPNFIFNGKVLSVNGDINFTTNAGRVVFITTSSGYNVVKLGDYTEANNNTFLEINDENLKYNFHLKNISHFLDTSGLTINGNITGSNIYISSSGQQYPYINILNVDYLTALYANVTNLSGAWLSTNGSNRVITSNGNGTFTAEANLKFNGNELTLDGDLNVSGNITAEQYIINSTVTNVTMSYSSGSTIFGDSIDDTHLFTGSVDISGALSIPGFSDVSASLAAAIAGGDNLGNHIATQDLDMAGNSISASLNITASGNISASGYISADHLILNPNTTTTGSNDTETQIDISLGNEEYKRGVIKRVFDWRENLASADDIDINNQVIADIGEFTKATFNITIELKGYRSKLGTTLYTNTASISQEINTHTVPTLATLGRYIELLYEEEAAILPIYTLFSGTVQEGNPIIQTVNNQIKFNIASNEITDAQNVLSSSLTTVYLDYQLYK